MNTNNPNQLKNLEINSSLTTDPQVVVQELECNKELNNLRKDSNSIRNFAIDTISTLKYWVRRKQTYSETIAGNNIDGPYYRFAGRGEKSEY